MISIPPARRASERRKIRAVSALTLKAAVFDTDAADNVTLTFDRLIAIASLDPSAIEVNDGEITGYLLRGTAAGTVQLAPTVLKVMLVQVSETTPGGVTLDASAGTGIVAVNDGGRWAGTSGLALPYP